MAIMIFKTDDGRVPGTEYLPCGELVPKAGMAMKLSGGKLAVASGDDLPVYLCVTERETACEDGEVIGAVRIGEDIVFEAATPEGMSAKIGESVQLAADGLGLSATGGGAAEVVYTDDEVTRFRIGTGVSAAAVSTAAVNTAAVGGTEIVTE